MGYNHQGFTPEEVKKGLLTDLLAYLLDYNKKSENYYYDIHITSDGYCTIVEWSDVSYDRDHGQEGKFQFVDYDEVVMKEVRFPDDHTELCYPEEAEDKLREWLIEHPEWRKNCWGCWTITDATEDANFRKIVDIAAKATINPCDYCVDDANQPTKDCNTCPNRPLMWDKETKDE